MSSNLCENEFQRCLEEAKKIPDEATRSLFEAECQYAYRDCVSKGETFSEIFSRRIAEQLAKKYEDMVSTRYSKCVSKILVHPLSEKCMKILTDTGIAHDIINQKDIDFEKAKTLLWNYKGKHNVDIDIYECLEIAKRLKHACEACLEYAKKPLKCLELELREAEPDKIEICWELVDKENIPIIMI